MNNFKLKRNHTNGKLRSLPKYRDWLELIYDAIPSRSALARECSCCELIPSVNVKRALVDTGEKKKITGSGEAYYCGFFTEGHGAFHERYTPQVSFYWGGVAESTFILYPPYQIHPPEPVETNFDGENANWVLYLYARLGEEEKELWYDYTAIVQIEEPVPGTTTPVEGKIEASCSFGARLFADIRDVGREQTTGAGLPWGPRPRYSDPMTKDACDLRGYKTADLNWYYWDKDEDGGTVTVKAFGHEVTITNGGGVPTVVGVGSTTMEEIEPRIVDGTGKYASSYLQMQFFGSQNLPTLTKSNYAQMPDEDGAIANTSGHRVTLTADTSGIETFRRARLELGNLQPEREIYEDMQCTTPGDKTIAAHSYGVVPLDGPDGLYPVNQDYPVDDPGTGGVDESAPLDAVIPSFANMGGTGTSYRVLATGNTGTPFSSLEIMNEDFDTIGEPAFGFVLDTDDLDLSADNWRVPLRIPAKAATWKALTLRVNDNPQFPDFPEIAPGSGGSTITGGNYVSNISGKARAHVTLDDHWLLSNYRYLHFELSASVEDQPATITIGDKTWDIFLPGSRDFAGIDLCVPANATGYDKTSSRLEVRSQQGGWGWGIDGSVTISIESDEAFWWFGIRPAKFQTYGRLLIGETLQTWRNEFKVGTFKLNEGKLYEEEITSYGTRGLLYLHDGRIVLDEEFGLTADGFQFDNVEYRALQTVTISDLIRAANLRQDNSSHAALALLKDESPAIYYETVDWDGRFRWYDHEQFFNNQAESYMLRPMNKTLESGTQEIMADYCVDRIKPGVGVSMPLESKKWVRGGLHGITVYALEAESMSISAGDSDGTSGPTGAFVLPGDEYLESNTNYSIESGWNDDPEQDVVEGTLMRVTVIND